MACACAAGFLGQLATLMEQQLGSCSTACLSCIRLLPTSCWHCSGLPWYASLPLLFTSLAFAFHQSCLCFSRLYLTRTHPLLLLDIVAVCLMLPVHTKAVHAWRFSGTGNRSDMYCRTDCLAQASHTGPHCCLKSDARQHPVALRYAETSPGQGLPNVIVLWI